MTIPATLREPADAPDFQEDCLLLYLSSQPTRADISVSGPRSDVEALLHLQP